MGYHQLRLVDRDRACRNIDLGDPSFVSPALENVNQPLSGSDDNLCGDLCRFVSALSHRAAMAGLLDASFAESIRFPLGEFQFTVVVGCICNLDLLFRFTRILVPRSHS